MESYDALLFVSFGGPEGPDDVMPFLENVLRGRPVPRERMLEVAEHYQQFGGVSPLNEQNRQLIRALEAELNAHECYLPVFFGNRNWHPMLEDTLADMYARGHRRALAFFTSPYSSYSSCRQYRENIAEACRATGLDDVEVHKLRAYFNHPGFIHAAADRVGEALKQLGSPPPSSVQFVFTAHSIPISMASNCDYVRQLNEASRLVSDAVGAASHVLVYQSRSGPPSQPWLEPDVVDYLENEIDRKRPVVIVPIGFISDHMEVVYDLDVEAREAADRLGIQMVRAGTVGVHPRFVQMIRELIVERIAGSEDRPALGSLGPWHDTCPVDCCPAPVRRAGPSQQRVTD